MAKATQATPGLADDSAVRLAGRLIEEQVVVLDNTLERLASNKGNAAARAAATAAAAASMMSVSLALNHVLSRVDSLTPQLLTVINNGLFQYIQKLLMILPDVNAQGLTVTLTTSMPPAATLTLNIQP